MTKIQKDRYEKDFTLVKNYPLKDPTISLKAKGAFMYLWSLPNDWDFKEKEIVKHSTDGKRSLNTAIKELRSHDYIEINRLHTGKTSWILHEVPESPSHRPHPRNADLRNAHLRNEDVYKGLTEQRTNSTKRRPKTSDRKPENSNQRPRIMQAIIGYFPTMQTYYKRQMMDDSVTDWLKYYTPEQIMNAIDSAQKYQMTVRRIGAPLQFLSSTLDRQARKAKRQQKQERQRKDTPNVDKVVEQYQKDDGSLEEKIAKNMKKKGLA